MSDLQKIEDYLKEVTYFSFATVDGNKPKVRPLAFHLFMNETLYFGVGDFKEVYMQIQDNPYIEIAAVKENGWLRYYGKAVFEQDNTIANMLLEKMPAMKQIYNEQTGYGLKIFHLKEATAEFRTKMGISESYQF